MSRTANADWTQWFIPGVFPMTILEIAGERGLAPEVALARAGICMTPSEIADSGLTLGQHLKLTRVVHTQLKDPALATEVGWRLPPTALGSVGHAILASSTVGEAVGVLERFWHLIGRASSIHLDTRGEMGTVAIDVRLPVALEQRALIQEISFVAMYRGIAALVPHAASQSEVWFDFPEPSHGGRLRERLGNVQFEMPACQFRFPTRLLDTPLPMSNPVGFRAAVQRCIREESERGLGDSRILARLQAELKPGACGYPSLDEMGKRLGMAPRTLRRHLQSEGTRYSSLVETARRREATRLLDSSMLTAHEIAELLGYVDAANFTRAFRRWTGQTPSAYRSRMRSDDDGDA